MAQEAAVPLQEATVYKSARKPLMVRLGQTARHHPLGAIGVLILMLMLVCAVGSDFVSPYDPYQVSSDVRESPSLEHPFGTDRLGRDVMSRTIWGARISMFIGVVAVFLGSIWGTALGIMSGYFGKVIDSIIQRIIDMILAIPALVLLLAIISVTKDPESKVYKVLVWLPIPETTFLGMPNFLQLLILCLGFSIAVSVGMARVVRGAVLSLKENVYIEAARAMGASDRRIMLRHILPNVIALVVVLSTIFLPLAILAEAAISFLGLGVPQPTASWGADLTGNNQNDAINRNVWWVVFFPGLALSLTVLAFNMIGDSLRDISDPRLRGGGGPGAGGGRGAAGF
jgi:peptide/nickel transport system permease protein